MMTILVPTDFSNCARKAANFAMKISQKTGSLIHFLHLEDIPPGWLNIDDNQKLLPEVTARVKRAKSELDSLVTLSNSRQLTAKSFLLYNRSYEAILDHAREHQVDLIVMGSKGASGLKEFMLGSYTQKIVRLSDAPVLVIKESAAVNLKTSRIAFVSDFQEEVMDQFLKFVKWAKVLNAKLLLVFINTPVNFTDTLTIKMRMGNYAMHAPGMVHNTYIFNDHQFEDGLTKFCKEEEVDIIGMITHGRSPGWQIFNNSLTESIVNHLDTPVLTMHF